MILAFFLLQTINATELSTLPKKEQELILKKLTKSSSFTEVSIPDPLTDGAPNKKLLELLDKNKGVVGYARKVVTTTGCNSGCLPLMGYFFFDVNGEFLEVVPLDRFTKIFHEPFSSDDYTTLDLFLRAPPPQFLKVKKTAELLDAVTEATKVGFEGSAVKGAVGTSFRLLQYLQQSQEFLKKTFLIKKTK